MSKQFWNVKILVQIISSLIKLNVTSPETPQFKIVKGSNTCNGELFLTINGNVWGNLYAIASIPIIEQGFVAVGVIVGVGVILDVGVIVGVGINSQSNTALKSKTLQLFVGVGVGVGHTPE